jgi:hypothetical protein
LEKHFSSKPTFTLVLLLLNKFNKMSYFVYRPHLAWPLPFT